MGATVRGFADRTQRNPAGRSLPRTAAITAQKKRRWWRLCAFVCSGCETRPRILPRQGEHSRTNWNKSTSRHPLRAGGLDTRLDPGVNLLLDPRHGPRANLDRLRKLAGPHQLVKRAVGQGGTRQHFAALDQGLAVYIGHVAFPVLLW